MKTALVSLALAAGAFAQPLIVNTPYIRMSFSANPLNSPGLEGFVRNVLYAPVKSFFNELPAAPYLLEPVYTLLGYLQSILPANDPSGPPVADLGLQRGTTFTWLAQPAGNFGIRLSDATGQPAQSAPFVVQDDPNAPPNCGLPPPTTTRA
ncbi:hypothetical protein P691DRAFT_791469 [Macrolepiota fuliginosa MF-IS2]|uniref:Uncharacterized protein n=1 Tax=Macrolepiota fuliginosa MF-IS2 TaxID=1400762 RepID=A0A9P5XH44_9AGAR|nr:hypothetical protein P691DRAFT_791469 [Macrolepiota fuliginosa MF-IS2]